jgi:hypothetical protein
VIHEGSREIGDGGVIAYTDETAFAAFAENQRVIFVLNGAGAVRRYTHWHPDTATFEYRRYADLDISCDAEIQYINDR